MTDSFTDKREGKTPEEGDAGARPAIPEGKAVYQSYDEKASGEVVYDIEPPPVSVTLARVPGSPMRLAFGDMAGFLFLVWLPILLAFIVPWEHFIPRTSLFGGISAVQLLIAFIIAFPPWIVLLLHLARGRLWDGIMDMLLWVIWECAVMITFCYLYPARAEQILGHATEYWTEMSRWIATGQGVESDPSQWVWIHLKNLVLLLVGGLVFGLPALMMGVLQLNYMNFYVAKCLLASESPLHTLPIAWHFYSIMRVVGFIILASTMFQICLRLVRRAPVTALTLWSGVIIGLLFVVADGLLKLWYAERVRLMLRVLTDI